MALRPKEYLVGQGEVHVQPINSVTGVPTGPLMWLGNVPGLSFGATTESTTHQESHTGRMSTDLEWETTLEVTASMTLEDFSPEVLALIVRGAYEQTVAGTAVTAYKLPWNVKSGDGFVVPTTATGSDTAVNLSAVTVSGQGGTPELELGHNYTVDLASGLFSVGDLTTDSSGGAITVTQPLEIDYTPGPARVVRAFALADQFYRLVFKGVNKVNPNERITVTAWKVKFTPAEEVALISTEVGSYDVTGSVLQDATRAANDQYYTIQKVEVGA